jgi:hypothetical protein
VSCSATRKDESLYLYCKNVYGLPLSGPNHAEVRRESRIPEEALEGRAAQCTWANGMPMDLSGRVSLVRYTLEEATVGVLSHAEGTREPPLLMVVNWARCIIGNLKFGALQKK